MKKYLILIVTLLLITGCADKLEEKGFSKDERTYIKENLNDDVGKISDQIRKICKEINQRDWPH